MLSCDNSPSSSLGLLGLSGLLILSHLEQLVRQAFGVRTVGLTELGNVHHVGLLKIYPLNFTNKINNCELLIQMTLYNVIKAPLLKEKQ